MKIILVALFFTSLSNLVLAHGDENHMKYTSKAKSMFENGKKYHQDVDIIRRMHPDFMIHKRDKTLREGIRNEEHSLKSCVNCHGGFDKNNKAIRIDNNGQFCSDCHKKVGTSLDCFGCHKATSSLSIGDK